MPTHADLLDNIANRLAGLIEGFTDLAHSNDAATIAAAKRRLANYVAAVRTADAAGVAASIIYFADALDAKHQAGEVAALVERILQADSPAADARGWLGGTKGCIWNELLKHSAVLQRAANRLRQPIKPAANREPAATWALGREFDKATAKWLNTTSNRPGRIKIQRKLAPDKQEGQPHCWLYRVPDVLVARLVAKRRDETEWPTLVPARAAANT